MKKDKNAPIRVIDITGKMDNYVTLEKFMKKTEYKFSCDFNMAGKGVVSSDKVRVYYRFWGQLGPAKIKLDWNDDDAMPFVYYLDQKGRIQFGSQMKGIQTSLIKWNVAALVTPIYIIREGYGQNER
jgi:hypothetical protein